MSEEPDKMVNVEHSSSIEETPSNDRDGAKNSPETTKPILEQARRRGLQPPEIIANLTPEQREELEGRLRRKIDLRLMPTIVIMYIMNYIDRCVLQFSGEGFGLQELTGLETTSLPPSWPTWRRT
jgi:hypothetical protein